MIGYLDKAIKPLVLIMSKISWCVQTFKVEHGDKDKNNKLRSFHVDIEKLLRKYKAISTNIEDVNIELNALPAYDVRYIQSKIRTYFHKVSISFHGLNVPEDGIECESFTVISIDSLLAYKNKFYLQVFLDKCTYKFASKQITDILISYKCCIAIKLI